VAELIIEDESAPQVHAQLVAFWTARGVRTWCMCIGFANACALADAFPLADICEPPHHESVSQASRGRAPVGVPSADAARVVCAALVRHGRLESSFVTGNEYAMDGVLACEEEEIIINRSVGRGPCGLSRDRVGRGPGRSSPPGPRRDGRGSPA
jgi:hypothetical protein